jgi:hypothetical protein
MTSSEKVAGSGDQKKELRNDYADGYRMGMRTGIEFVMLYCKDYLACMDKKVKP